MFRRQTVQNTKFNLGGDAHTRLRCRDLPSKSSKLANMKDKHRATMTVHRCFKPVASRSSPNGPLRADENMSKIVSEGFQRFNVLRRCSSGHRALSLYQVSWLVRYVEQGEREEEEEF